MTLIQTSESILVLLLFFFLHLFFILILSSLTPIISKHRYSHSGPRKTESIPVFTINLSLVLSGRPQHKVSFHILSFSDVDLFMNDNSSSGAVLPWN